MESLRIWVNETPVGRLRRNGRGVSFVYDDGVARKDAVSMLMPVQPASYDDPYRMLPIFDTNMPEGDLALRIHRVLAKDDRGRVDPLDVLAMTGGNQIGRIRVLPEGETPERREPLGPVDALLARSSTPEMVDDLIQNYGLRSGVSGAMPKTLAETEGEAASRTTVQTRDWILKFAGDGLDGLCLNEYHCLRACAAAGNETSDAALSDDGRMLAVRRFDFLENDARVGFEDFAALNWKRADQKYEGSIETGLMKRAAEFSGSEVRDNLERLYRRILTSVALRDGDAHLKNFALLYEDTEKGPARLSPAYDVVTTRAHDEFRKDPMALTLGGTKRWPKPAALKSLGGRARLKPAQAEKIMGEVAAGVAAEIPEMVRNMRAQGHGDLAEKMAEEWNDGLVNSLGADPVEVPPPEETCCDTPGM